MMSYLLLSKNKQDRIDFVNEYCRTNMISIFDLTLIDRDKRATVNTQSIGIDDIKKMQEKIILKPMQSKMKVVFLNDADILTTEAQNALLKILEEPPDRTQIMLGAESKDALLKTIQSRCKICILRTNDRSFSKKERDEYERFIDSLHALTIAERLKKAEVLSKNKDEAILWIENLVILLHEKIISPENVKPQTITVMKNLQKLHTVLKTTNVNPRFALEDTFLHLSVNS